MSEISSNWFSSAKIMISTYQNLDPKSKEMVIRTVNEFFRIGKDQITIKRPRIKR